MSAPSESSRVAAVGRSLRWRARLRTRGLGAQTGMLLLLGLVAVLSAVAIVYLDRYAPVTLLLVPLLVASLLLGPRVLPWFVVFVLTLAVLAVLGRRLRDVDISPASVTSASSSSATIRNRTCRTTAPAVSVPA